MALNHIIIFLGLAVSSKYKFYSSTMFDRYCVFLDASVATVVIFFVFSRKAVEHDSSGKGSLARLFRFFAIKDTAW